MRESDYHRSAYVKMCQKRNDTRKELIKKIKRADLVSNVVTCLYGNTTRANAYRDGLMDAFCTLYGQDEADRLWEYLDKRRERITRLINHMIGVKTRGELK